MAVTKSEGDGNHPASHYLIVEDPEHPSGWHLRVRDANGNVDHGLLGAAWAALHGGYRGNKYQGPGKEEALRKLKALYKSEGMELPSGQESEVRSQKSEGKTVNVFSRSLRLQLDEPIAVDGKSLYPLTVCVTGTWVKNGHKFSITAEDLASMAANFQKRKNEQLVIDYEHASEQPDVARGGPVPAAGWIHELTVETGKSKLETGNSDGGPARLPSGTGPVSNFQFPVSLAALVEWTPEARSLIAGGQYRFFSPAIDWSFADKETGEPQGPTLTSGALTNHPFLEELPAITLSDADLTGFGVSRDPVGTERDFPRPRRDGAGFGKEHEPRNPRSESRVSAADTSTGYLDQPLTGGRDARATSDQGAKMAKKLSIKKLDGGDLKGHHGIFDGDEMMGYVHADDMRDHVKKNADDFDDLFEGKGQAGVKGHQEPDAADGDKKMSELLRDSGFGVRDSGKTPSQIILDGLKLAATHQLVEQREGSRNLLLTECLKPVEQSKVEGRAFNLQPSTFDSERAKQLLRDGKINGSDLLDAIEAKSLLDDAVTRGKVLPKDRAFFFEIAFNHPKKFSEYIAGAVPVLRLGTIGLGSTDQVPVDQEVDLETKKLMSEKKLSYGKAMKELFRANPQLEERYRAAHRQEVKADAAAATRNSAGITP